MLGNSQQIKSKQKEAHPDLIKIIKKHTLNNSKISPHPRSKDHLELIKNHNHYKKNNLILDTGCGTGESSIFLAKKYPEQLIIGIDKSKKRINIAIKKQEREECDNLIFIRDDLISFWMQCYLEKIELNKHFFLYPNPWPKKRHIIRRWHAHPIFPFIIALKGELTLRTNWKVYAEEMQITLESYKLELELIKSPQSRFMTNFEIKYKASRHTIFELNATL